MIMLMIVTDLVNDELVVPHGEHIEMAIFVETNVEHIYYTRLYVTRDCKVEIDIISLVDLELIVVLVGGYNVTGEVLVLL
jgi:hypothetical protein